MAMVPGANKRRRRKRRRGLEDDDELLDRISLLPDDVLGDIVSLLPTKDGARTQLLSSRWRHIWRSAPLNFALDTYPAPFGGNTITTSLISRILSTHQGPGRRFSIPDPDGGRQFLFGERARDLFATSLDCWLESPALDGLQELEFHYYNGWNLAMPLSLHRFSSTLRVATFGSCNFPVGYNAGGLQFPVLTQLSLSDVIFSGSSSFRALLAACPVLQSLLLIGMMGWFSFRVACPTIRSIGVKIKSSYGSNSLEYLIIEDAPCLERLHFFNLCWNEITISVISAPKLHVLGPLSGRSPTLKFGATVLQGSSGFVSLKMAVHSVKVLSLKQEHLSLDMAIDFIKCFPYLEKLYIQTRMGGEKKNWCNKYQNLIGTLDIRLKKIVLAGYRGSTSHANFAKFFVLSARMLQSLRLELSAANPVPSDAWINRQHRLLHIENKASRDMQLDFAHGFSRSFSCFCPEHVHDLSRADPFL